MMIRPYRESDLEAVVRLFTESVHQVAKPYYDARQLAAWAPQPPDLNRWAARLASSRTLVAEAHDTLAGFVSYQPSGYIDLLYTSPAHCRRGVAAALCHHAQTDLAAAGVVELFTEASVAARPFFERLGFALIEEQDVERDGVILRRYAMRKRLIISPSAQA